MVAVRKLIAAIFLVSPCVRKELLGCQNICKELCGRSCRYKSMQEKLLADDSED